jgi:hypothetical protein
MHSRDRGGRSETSAADDGGLFEHCVYDLLTQGPRNCACPSKTNQTSKRLDRACTVTDREARGVGIPLIRTSKTSPSSKTNQRKNTVVAL